eukprot:3862595-Prymnesium_polylepis.3
MRRLDEGEMRAARPACECASVRQLGPREPVETTGECGCEAMPPRHVRPWNLRCRDHAATALHGDACGRTLLHNGRCLCYLCYVSAKGACSACSSSRPAPTSVWSAPDTM